MNLTSLKYKLWENTESLSYKNIALHCASQEIVCPPMSINVYIIMRDPIRTAVYSDLEGEQ